jgi:outer membrane protein OmpA-like peptidoglycan-associated protein
MSRAMRPSTTRARPRASTNLDASPRAWPSASRVRRALAALVGLVAAGSAPATARATDCDASAGLSTCIDADTLWLRPGGGGRFAVAPVETLPAGRASFGLGLSYLSRPVSLRVGSADPSGTVVHAIDNALDATFLLGLGLTDGIELDAAAPVTLLQDGAGVGDVVGSSKVLPRSAMRDVRVGLAAALLPRPRVGSGDGLALTSRFDLALSTGGTDAFSTNRSVVGAPSFVLDWRRGRLDVALELGARLREKTSIAGATVGSQLAAGLAASYDLLAKHLLTVGAEAYALPTFAKQAAPARLAATETSGPPLVPAEWMLTASSAPLLAGDVGFSLAGGGALPLTSEPALTAPRLRFTLAVRYAPTGHDRDGDGVLDRDDKCPDEPEDKDGFQDDDGCPDPDNDGDGIPDVRDRCRDAAEDFDGFQDDDGCPDLDDDGDGIPDAQDKCRNEPEDRDGFQDEDGCPDPDNDGDGIPDVRDRCPNDPEDKDGFQDDDGCPDLDNDGDGVPDALDKCPTAAEDRDGFEDDDGCPDPDNDQDGVLDAADACPLTPETIDGNADDDGCPEPGARSLVSWAGDRVVLERPAPFRAGRAELSPEQLKQVRMAAQLARGHAPLESVLVKAWPDRPGDASDRAVDLASARAAAVRDALATNGIPKDIVTAAAGEPDAKRTPKSGAFELTVRRAARGTAPSRLEAAPPPRGPATQPDAPAPAKSPATPRPPKEKKPR